MKKVIVFLLISVLLLGCRRTGVAIDNSSNINNKRLPDTFGAELYNGSYWVYGEDDAELYDISFMSRIDIPSDSMVKLQYEGGDFECYTELIKQESKNIGEYYLYILSLDLTHISFEDKIIDINNIIIYYDKENTNNYINLEPNKFNISCVEGNTDNMDLYFKIAPIVIPCDMEQITYQVATEKTLTISDIIASNDDFCIKNVADYKNMKIGMGDKDVRLLFSVSDNELSEYTQYGTTIAIKYIVDEVEYVVIPPSRVLTYNPVTLYENNFERYYNEVLMK